MGSRIAWWARTWLGIRKPNASDKAIGVLELIETKGEPEGAYRARARALGGTRHGDSDQELKNRFDVVDRSDVKEQNLIDVLPWVDREEKGAVVR
jgi:hypothetical protein